MLRLYGVKCWLQLAITDHPCSVKASQSIYSLVPSSLQRVWTLLCCDFTFIYFFLGLSQQEWRGELQQSGQPGEGLRGQIQARPQKMRRPSQIKLSCSKCNFLSLEWGSLMERQSFFWYLHLLSNEDVFFFYRISYFARKKKYPIRNCNARALYFA